MSFKPLLVLERIVHLCIRHGAGLEPAVQYFGDSLHCAAALAAPGDVVHKVLVQVHAFYAGKLLQLGPASHTVGLAALVALPDWNRVTPVSVSGDSPVPCALKPLSEAAFLEVGRNPVDLAVCLEHLVLDLLNIHEPRGNSSIDKRRMASPAVRIVMHVVLAENQLALSLEPCDDVLVTVLYESSLVIRYISCELALCVNRTDNRNAGSLKGVVIVLTEAAGCMYDTSTILGGYVCCREYPECTLLLDGCEVVEQRLISHAHQLASLLGPEHLVVALVLVICCKPCLCHDVALVAVFNLNIVDVRVHSQSLVGWQCPWGCGPCQEVCVLLPFHLELDGDCRVCVLLIAAQVQLVVGKYSGAS